MAISFGELLGIEILTERRAKGWTQTALATRAFFDPKADRRVREYERGRVKRPQPKVYVPICEALGITQRRIGELKALAGDGKEINLAEIKQLRAEKGSLQKALSDLKSLPRVQLETLARMFDMAKPFKRSDQVLLDFLRKKAEDYQALRTEIETIDDGLLRISKLKRRALKAYEAGDLDEVEQLLANVQRLEFNEAASTAELRAKNALLRGQVRQAYKLLSHAADLFQITDPIEPVRRRREYQKHFYSHGMRYGGDALRYMERMVREAISSAYAKQDVPLWAWLHINLGNAVSDQGERLAGEDAKRMLMEALDYYDVVFDLPTSRLNDAILGAAKNNRGSVLHALADRQDALKAVSTLRESESAYFEALKHRKRPTNPGGWAECWNNIGDTRYAVALRLEEKAAIEEIEKAIDAFEKALKVSTRAADRVHWAIIKYNLGLVFRLKGSLDQSEVGLTLLQNANALFKLSLEVRTREDHPLDWALTQEGLADTWLSIAEHDAVSDKSDALKRARFHADKALGGYDSKTMSFAHERVRALKTRIDQCMLV